MASEISEAVETLELDVGIRSYKILELTPEKEWLAVSRKKIQYLFDQNASIPLHIITIIGDGHGGKSFLMNLLINYLKNNCTDVKGVMDRSSGFRFGFRKAGTPVFNMVLVYPEVFVKKTSDGKTYGILLMDIQGLFDGYDRPAVLDQFKLCKSMSSTMLVNFVNETYAKDTIESILTCLNGYNEISNHTNLVFLLRDEDDVEFSSPLRVNPLLLEAFVKDLGNYEENYRLLMRRFNKILWFSLPRPSNAVISNKFKGIVENSPPKYLKAVKILFAEIIQPNFPCLLTGAEWSIIFQRMTLASKVQWTKFSKAFIFSTNIKFYSNRETDSTPVNDPNSTEIANAVKIKKKRNKKNKNNNAADGETANADANTSVQEKLSSVNEKKSTPKPLLAKEKEPLEPLPQRKKPEEKTSGETGKSVPASAKPIKQNSKKEPAANKIANDKFVQSSDKSKSPSKTKPADKVKNINLTTSGLPNTSKNEMINQWLNNFSENGLKNEKLEPVKNNLKDSVISSSKKIQYSVLLGDLIDFSNVAESNEPAFTEKEDWVLLERKNVNSVPSILDQINKPNVDAFTAAENYYSNLKKLTVNEVEAQSNNRMASFLLSNDSLVGYRDLCSSIMRRKFELSPDHYFLEVYSSYREQLKQEVITETVNRAIQLAVEDYKKKMMNLSSVGMSKLECSALHEKVTSSIISSYILFWDGPIFKQKLCDALETAYYGLLSEFCQNRFDKQMESVLSVNDLYNADVNILNEFFSSDMWLKLHNKVNKHVLSTILLNKLTDKATTLLKLGCETILDEYVNGSLTLLVSTGFDETYESVKNKAVSVMQQINKLAVDDLVRELNQIKMKYDGIKASKQ